MSTGRGLDHDSLLITNLARAGAKESAFLVLLDISDRGSRNAETMSF